MGINLILVKFMALIIAKVSRPDGSRLSIQEVEEFELKINSAQEEVERDPQKSIIVVTPLEVCVDYVELFNPSVITAFPTDREFSIGRGCSISSSQENPSQTLNDEEDLFGDNIQEGYPDGRGDNRGDEVGESNEEIPEEDLKEYDIIEEVVVRE